MSTEIQTNKIIYMLDKNAFNDLYDVYYIETSDKYIKNGAAVLDIPILDNRIKSIRFESGRKLAVLLEHSEDNRKLLKSIISSIDNGEALYLVEPNVETIDDFVILQLLLNALGSYNSKFLRCNNLTGHMYCFCPELLKHGKKNGNDIIWQIPSLEISISNEYLLLMNVRTFTSVLLMDKIEFNNTRFEEYPQYVFSANNSLRRKLGEDNDSGYILRQIKGQKSEMQFMDIQSNKSFLKTKMGLLNNVIHLFNDNYTNIANISFEKINTVKQLCIHKREIKENKENVRAILSSKNVRIVDYIRDTYSKVFCEDIVDLIYKKYGVKSKISKNVSSDSLNICLIHNASYYSDDSDPHQKQYKKSAVQHITFEDFQENSENAIDTVIQDIIIKEDLINGKISLYNWDELKYDTSISFGMEKEIDSIRKYFFMEVKPDGSFNIIEQELNLFEYNQFSESVEIYEDARTRGEIIKGIIRTEDGYINVIKDTKQYTIPEIIKISDLLSSGDNKLRGKDRRSELLSASIDINMYEDGDSQFYYVGMIGEGMRQSIRNAAVIRKIERHKDSPELLEKVLPLMNVVFVRNGQLTVIPFPFKYLREYIKGYVGRK